MSSRTRTLITLVASGPTGPSVLQAPRVARSPTNARRRIIDLNLLSENHRELLEINVTAGNHAHNLPSRVPILSLSEGGRNRSGTGTFGDNAVTRCENSNRFSNVAQ